MNPGLVEDLNAPADRPPGWQASGLAALGLFLVSALALPGTLVGREIFERDVDLMWATQMAAVVRALAEGAWPLWDPRAGFGQPLLANPNVQALYPPTWLALLLPPGLAYVLVTHLHLVLAGLGVRALAARLGRGPLASWLAGALFVAAGPTLSFVNMWNHLAGLAWLPWLLLLADRALCEPTRRAGLLWGGAAAAQALAGSPDFCLITHGCTAFLAVFRLAGGPSSAAARRPRSAQVAVTSLAALVAIGLAAAQWLPTAELVSRSDRAALPAQARLFWSLPWPALAQFALPLRFDAIPRLAPPAAAAPLAELWNPLLVSLYVGPLGLGLAAAGLALPGRARFALLALGAGAIVLALGRHTPLYGVACTLFPPLAALRHPAKFAGVVSVAVALLAASGFERLVAGHVRGFRATLGGIAAAVLLLAVGGPPMADLPGTPTWRALFEVDPASLATSAALAVAALLANGRSSAVPVVALAAVITPLAFNHSANATAPAGFLAARPHNASLVRALGERAYVWDYGEPGRLPVPGLPGALLDVPYEPRAQAVGLALREYLLPPSGGRWGLAGSYERDLMGFFDRPQQAAVAALRVAEGTSGYTRLLQRGGVEVVVALHGHDHVGLRPRGELRGLFRRPIHAFSVPDPLPRAFAVSGARSVASDRDGVLMLADAGFDPRLEVALAGGVPRSAAPDFATRVTIVGRRADAVVLEAELSHPGHLVVLEAWDPGWRAEVDGTAAPVLRANGLFRAVPLSAGRHRIALRYRPAAALAGFAVSLGMLLSVAFAWRTARARAT